MYVYVLAGKKKGAKGVFLQRKHRPVIKSNSEKAKLREKSSRTKSKSQDMSRASAFSIPFRRDTPSCVRYARKGPIPGEHGYHGVDYHGLCVFWVFMNENGEDRERRKKKEETVDV
jgi:hypothetical protein